MIFVWLIAGLTHLISPVMILWLKHFFGYSSVEPRHSVPKKLCELARTNVRQAKLFLFNFS